MIARKRRTTAKARANTQRPRLCVRRTNTRLIAQVIDDKTGTTLAYVSSDKVAGKTPAERAKNAGAEIAKQALAKKATAVVFDRAGLLYTGNIKTFADAAREAGLNF